jgi:hypothetical protein
MSNELTTASNPMAEFQERVIKKLQADIGEMLPPDVLQKLVERAIEEQFMKPRKVRDPNRGYGDYMIDAPSWFSAEVFRLCTPMMNAAVRKWVDENETTLREAIEKFLADQNLLLLATAAIQQQTSQQMFRFAMDIVQALPR